MAEYIATIYRRSNLPCESDFWNFLQKYNGGALSNPINDDSLLGKAYTAIFSLSRSRNLEALKGEFPNLDITNLELLV